MSKRILISSIVLAAIITVGVSGFFYFKSKKINPIKQLEVSQKESSNKEIPTRDQIDEKYKWDLTQFYKSNQEWQDNYNKFEKEYMPQFPSFANQLDNPDQAIKCLKLLDEASILSEKLYYFASNSSNQDLSDSTNNERLSKLMSMFSRFDETTAFIEPELTGLPDRILQSYMMDPEFFDYQHYLSVLLRKKNHILPKEEEELLAKSADMSSSFSNIFSKLRDVDIEFPTVKDENNQDYQLSESRYSTSMDSPNRDFRERAYKGLLNTYAKYSNTIAEILNGKVKKDIFYSRAKKYDTALESFLDNDLINTKVYNNLITSTADGLDYLHRYISLRKKVLGIDAVHPYDIYAPLVKELDVEIPYEEGQQKVLTALAPLGEKYISDLNMAFNNRWIDVYETNNKTAGAYCNVNYAPHPFILLNYGNKFYDLKALAHETGHALNFYYSSQAQPYAKAGALDFNAEIPSNTNEILLSKYFANNASTDNEKLYYLNAFVDTVFSYFYTQVMFSEFELTIHERVEKGEALSVDYLNNLWGELLVKYLGPDYKLDEETRVSWARVPHFYIYDFYVYRYATSIAAANEFSKMVLSGDKNSSEKYASFLSSGKSDYPLEILKKSGIDMTSSKPYTNLLSDFNDALTEMETILKKQGKI